jgi:predicted membrane protein
MHDNESKEQSKSRKQGANVLAGLFLLGIGGILLSREIGFHYPNWLFTWPMVLIVVGFFIGVQRRFRDFGWLIVAGIGFFFLADDIWPAFDFSDYLWPAIIIGIGLLLIFRPRHRDFTCYDKHGRKEKDRIYDVDDDNTANDYSTGDVSTEEILEVVSVFGNVKKNIFSKTFRGGEIICVFAGADINLTQADFNKKIVLEVVQIFGGTKIIIPAHWQVRSEAVAIFGGIEDKRKPMPPTQEPERILVLKGFTLFGGLEIKSY